MGLCKNKKKRRLRITYHDNSLYSLCSRINRLSKNKGRLTSKICSNMISRERQPYIITTIWRTTQIPKLLQPKPQTYILPPSNNINNKRCSCKPKTRAIWIITITIYLGLLQWLISLINSSNSSFVPPHRVLPILIIQTLHLIIPVSQQLHWIFKQSSNLLLNSSSNNISTSNNSTSSKINNNSINNTSTNISNIFRALWIKKTSSSIKTWCTCSSKTLKMTLQGNIRSTKTN